jgi:hypothetical protein
VFDLELFKSECSEAERTLQLFEESNRLYTARP